MAGSIPTVQAPASLAWILLASPVPEQLPTLESGTFDFTGKVNEALARIEALARYSIGAPCVLEGLALTNPSGLTVQVATGLASIDGLVVVKSPVAYVVPDATAAVYLWLKQDGTVTHTTSSTPPTGKNVFLGQCETSGGSVASFTTHGVLTARGGSLWRTLGTAPADSPPASLRLWTQVGTAVYLWDGTSHRLIVS